MCPPESLNILELSCHEGAANYFFGFEDSIDLDKNIQLVEVNKHKTRFIELQRHAYSKDIPALDAWSMVASLVTSDDEFVLNNQNLLFVLERNVLRLPLSDVEFCQQS